MSTDGSEFQRGWPVVLAASSGVGLGIAGLLTYTAGVFAKDLAVGIGLSRTALGAAFFLSTVALALALPLVGWLIDRFGPRWPAIGGALGLALGFALLGTAVHSVAAYMLVMTGIGFIAAASSPVAHTRAVNAVFVRSRGLALGLTQLGIGLAAMIVPPVVAAVIIGYGWQAGYLALAAIAAFGVIPAAALPSGRNETRRLDSASSAEELRSPTFRLLLLSFGMMALAFAGLLPHFVPMLREAGLGAAQAAGLASIIGASVIVSRILVGWLADRISAPFIAAASCVLCAIGCLALAWKGAALAWLGAIALGSAMGAEADLIGYLTARYFRLANYGRLYAIQYAGFMLMAGLGPLWVGALADATGGYRTPLLVTVGGLVVAIVLFLRLPRVERASQA
ncbi:MFS transporter [Sphingomonas glaciei]|uniref:MFS transporter n=1 Tax=Sphingomonas glaciei TaxID=2938948 RepID=A0ABY5N1D0_9SPHN|nr:MFS transporter [Sphingomonas glaciei]UUR09362.1 MFS transporter [Sphingomonas glaciei]